MRRRAFLQAAGSAAIAWPLSALAATDTRPPLVAALLPFAEEFAKARLAALRDGLKDEGLLDGRHYLLEARFAGGDLARLPELAKELDALAPRVFVASATAAYVVHRLLPDRPLVFTGIATDPIASGLAQSYARAGGTATGNVMSAMGGEASLTAKRLGLFHDLIPNIKRLGMIGSAPVAEGQDSLLYQEETALRAAAGQIGIAIEKYAVTTFDDLGPVISKASADGVDALYISGQAILFSNMSRVMPHVVTAAKPTLGVYPEWAQAGLLMTYSNDLEHGFRRAGAYAAKIIKGTNPADLPIEQPSKFTLAINLKTAKRLGVDVPVKLQQLADQLIE